MQLDFWDVVETKDGDVWKGVVVEQSPGERYRIVVLGGNAIAIPSSEVKRVSKQKNPYRSSNAPRSEGPSQQGISQQGISQQGISQQGISQQAVPAGLAVPTAVAVHLPGPLARPRWRLAVSMGVAMPTGDLNELVESSFGVTVRGGYEMMWGRVGFTPAARFDAVVWSLGSDDVDASLLHFGADGRLALHFARVVPYVSFGLGGDLCIIEAGNHMETNPGLGMNLGVGSDFLISESFALGLGLNFHPGLTEVIENSDVKASYFGIFLAISTY